MHQVDRPTKTIQHEPVRALDDRAADVQIGREAVTKLHAKTANSSSIPICPRPSIFLKRPIGKLCP